MSRRVRRVAIVQPATAERLERLAVEADLKPSLAAGVVLDLAVAGVEAKLAQWVREGTLEDQETAVGANIGLLLANGLGVAAGRLEAEAARDSEVPK